jgi:hypothetical protein
MRKNWMFQNPSRLLIPFLIVWSSNVFAKTVHTNKNDIKVEINQQTGNYTIASNALNWTFSGTVGQAINSLKETTGTDKNGEFHQVNFQWNADNHYTASIQYYQNQPVVLFSLHVPDGAKHIEAKFPDFTKFPKDLNKFSYGNDVFSPHQFKLNNTSTPWLFFDNEDNAFILSPASDFIVSKMVGNGEDTIASGLNDNLANLPKNFSHQSVLIMEKGIANAWTDWGNCLRNIYGRIRPANDADKMLKYYGYWTDNGADYYYNYDTTKGYASTLIDLTKTYKQEGIPLGYVQLDSWWYDKSIYDPDGNPTADHKNKNLPFGSWNRYGGTMSYTANKYLFPNGLAAFQDEIKLPFVVHARWIDPHSPYHQKYKISGYAAVDPAFWKSVAEYLKAANVFCYEQDWLNYIYDKSPAMSTDLNVGNAFTDGMANGFKAANINMQYCMAEPRFFLQGVKYNNLTTIRTSDDRFEQHKWSPFIYNAQLAYALGIWPWCDVFKSNEMGNMILANLSAGPVGTGDAMGKENKKNILMTCREDGVLIKPAITIIPFDQTYIDQANNLNKPVLAWTYTKHNSLQTDYVFSFTEKNASDRNIRFKPATIGMQGAVVVFNPITKEAKNINASEDFNVTIGKDNYAYFEIAAYTPSGIALLGDEDKIVATGKQRIAAVKTSPKTLAITVAFATTEKSVTLHGFYEKPFKASIGKLTLDAESKYFTLQLPKGSAAEETVKLTVD